MAKLGASKPEHTIEIDTNGAFGKVRVDGVDVANWCTGYTITHTVTDGLTVSLTLVPGSVKYRGEAVQLQTVNALLAESAE